VWDQRKEQGKERVGESIQLITQSFMKISAPMLANMILELEQERIILSFVADYLSTKYL